MSYNVLYFTKFSEIQTLNSYFINKFVNEIVFCSKNVFKKLFNFHFPVIYTNQSFIYNKLATELIDVSFCVKYILTDYGTRLKIRRPHKWAKSAHLTFKVEYNKLYVVKLFQKNLKNTTAHYLVKNKKDNYSYHEL